MLSPPKLHTNPISLRVPAAGCITFPGLGSRRAQCFSRRSGGCQMTAEPQPTPEQTAPPPTAPQPSAPQLTAPQPTALPQHRIKRTRISGLWVSVGFFAVVLLLLLIFILQNGTKVDISY